MMSRFDWLKKETMLVPRRKFHIFEPRRLEDLLAVESCYGRLPSDYREFVQQFGHASLFRSLHGFYHNLTVLVPPLVKCTDSQDHAVEDMPVRIELGHFINDGTAWLEWGSGVFLHEAAVFVGHSWQQRKAAGSFEEWLKRSIKACRKLYTKEQWISILKPAPPFSATEQQIVDAIPKFEFRKVGVDPDGNALVEVANASSLELPFLTVGVRSASGMKGSVGLPIAGIKPGKVKTIEVAVYKGCMDPEGIELFRLPLPDEEDRQFFPELRPERV